MIPHASPSVHTVLLPLPLGTCANKCSSAAGFEVRLRVRSSVDPIQLGDVLVVHPASLFFLFVIWKRKVVAW